MSTPNESNERTQTLSLFQDDEPLNPRDERLIAYLENELTEEEKAALEQELATDPCLQHRLELLQASWQALDQLETISLNPDLTRSTLEMVAQYTASLAQKEVKRGRLVHLIYFGFAFLLLAGMICLGVKAISWFSPLSKVDLAKDREVIEQIDKLEAIGDYDFLCQLAETTLFAIALDSKANKTLLMTSSLSPGASPISSLPLEGDVPTAKPPKTDGELSPSEANVLSSEEQLRQRDFYRYAGRFYRLSSEKQQQLRLLWKQISLSPDQEVLLNVMNNYYDWFGLRLHETQRDLVISSPAEMRIDRIKSLFEETRQKGTFLDVSLPPRGTLPRESSPPLPYSGNFPPWQERGQTENLLRILPRELRGEDFRPLWRLFDEYRNQKWDEFSSLTETAERGNDRRKRYSGGVFHLVQEFIDEQTPENLSKLLSSAAQEYLNQQPEKEKVRILGFLLSIDFQRGMFGRRPGIGPNRPDSSREGFSEDARFPPRRNNTPNGWGNDQSFATATESTRELAETLRKLPQKSQDELLSLPAEEMYARLLAIHWGADPKLAPDRDFTWGNDRRPERSPPPPGR